MAVVRGIAINLDAGLGVCGAQEVATEEHNDRLTLRVLRTCPRPPALVWLGKVGVCEDHVLQLWPELGVSG